MKQDILHKDNTQTSSTGFLILILENLFFELKNIVYKKQLIIAEKKVEKINLEIQDVIKILIISSGLCLFENVSNVKIKEKANSPGNVE